MNVYDIILLILVGGFALFGLWFGFIHTVGSLVGTIVGAFAASRLYELFAVWIHNTIGGSLNAERALAFLLLFVIFNRLTGLGFVLIEKTFKFISVIPFLKTIDRLLGAVLGVLEGVLVIGLTLQVAKQFPFAQVLDIINSSAVAATLMRIASLLFPLLPRALREVVVITGF